MGVSGSGKALEVVSRDYDEWKERVEAAGGVGEGWRLLSDGEPLKDGDGFIHPDLPRQWTDYACRPELFRGNGEYAHRWPWRRRFAPEVEYSPGPYIPSKGTEDEPERWMVLREESPHYRIATIENGAPGDTLETEAATAALLAASHDMRLALIRAREMIRVLHGDEGWDLYQESPEMKQINAAIEKATRRPE